MSLVDELQKLEELHRSGALSDQEFAQAKAALLAGPAAPSPSEPIAHHLADQLAEVRYQNELARLDREWEIERQKYLITDRYGRRIVPTAGMGIGISVIGGVFGVIWTIIAIAITGSAPDFGPFAIVRVVFPLFGVVFIVAAISFGIYCSSRAKAYERALTEYQARRSDVRPESFH